MGLCFNHGFAKVILENTTDSDLSIMFLDTKDGKSTTETIHPKKTTMAGNIIDFLSVLPAKEEIKAQFAPAAAWSLELGEKDDIYTIKISKKNGIFNIAIEEEWGGEEEKIAPLKIDKPTEEKPSELRNLQKQLEDLQKKSIALIKQLTPLKEDAETNKTQINAINSELEQIKAKMATLSEKIAAEAKKQSAEEPEEDVFADIEDIK